MIYSHQTCPYCGAGIGQTKNPSLKIGNPYRKCHKCGKIYTDSYSKEWINMSSFEKLKIKSSYLFKKDELDRDIRLSKLRTQVIEYVELLKQSGYEIKADAGETYASYHDNTATIVPHMFIVPVDINEPKVELENIKQFEQAIRQSGVNYIKIYQTTDIRGAELSHEEKIFLALNCYKSSVKKALFPKGMTDFGRVIDEICAAINLVETRCEAIHYYELSLMYLETVVYRNNGLTDDKIKEKILDSSKEYIDKYIDGLDVIVKLPQQITMG